METRERDDLPILDELRDDLAAAYAREERAQAGRHRRRRGRWVAALAAVLLVAVPGAVATRSIWAPTPAEDAPGRPFEGSRPVEIATGRGDVLQWRLSAYSGDRGVCWQMAQFSATESAGTSVSCLADKPEDIAMTTEVSGAFGETLVYGYVPPEVARVEVELAGSPRQDARIVTVPPEAAARAGLPADLRFYVTSFSREFTPETPRRVVALDAGGRVVDRVASGASRPRR